MKLRNQIAEKARLEALQTRLSDGAAHHVAGYLSKAANSHEMMLRLRDGVKVAEEQYRQAKLLQPDDVVVVLTTRECFYLTVTVRKARKKNAPVVRLPSFAKPVTGPVE